MIPLPPEPTYKSGTRVLVTQHVRVGHLKWVTRVAGEVLEESVRPVGGMEMGDKALYTRQATLLLRKDDGEITTVALDPQTEVEELPKLSPTTA